MAYWHEPIDIMNSGPEFFEGLTELIIESAKAYMAKRDKLTQNDVTDLQKLQSLAIQCLFGAAILSANYDYIIGALQTINEYELLVKSDPAFCSAVFADCQDTLKSFLSQIKQVINL